MFGQNVAIGLHNRPIRNDNFSSESLEIIKQVAFKNKERFNNTRVAIKDLFLVNDKLESIK
jgi:hypothetical protein